MRNDKSKKILKLVKSMESLAYKLKSEDKNAGNCVLDLLWEIKKDNTPEKDIDKLYK